MRHFDAWNKRGIQAVCRAFELQVSVQWCKRRQHHEYNGIADCGNGQHFQILLQLEMDFMLLLDL